MIEDHKETKKELLFYSVIVILLLFIIACNNLFWKIGKSKVDDSIKQNNLTYFESNNIIYKIPYEEQWLD